MIQCIIIDDEPNAREFMHMLIERHFADKLKVVALAASVKEGVAAIEKHQPDIVFLDIEMPVENGFKLFSHFRVVEFETIFTTAYQNHAIDAIKHAALDYLLKPINLIDLAEAIKRFDKRHEDQKKPDEKIAVLLNQLKSQKDTYGKIAIPTMTGFYLERISNILYCEADHNITRIHSLSGESILSSKPLMFFEEALPAALFFRIHKSTLLNITHVKRYSHNDGFKVSLENGITLEVATRRNDEFVKMLTQHK